MAHSGPNMQTYYEILGVDRRASLPEIKRAFREKAKQIHPDIAGEKKKSLNTGLCMEELLNIYKTLIDPELRGNYDRSFTQVFRKKETFNYRSWLLSRNDDPESMAKLIFFDLLNLREVEAVMRWLDLGGVDFPLKKYLNREDWMDCSFILAEELDKQGDPWAATYLLFELIAEEKRLPYFRHFAPELELLLQAIVRTRLVGFTSDELVIDCLEEMLELPFPPKERARYWHMMGDAYERIGDSFAANTSWAQALACDPRIRLAQEKKRRAQGAVYDTA